MIRYIHWSEKPNRWNAETLCGKIVKYNTSASQSNGLYQIMIIASEYTLIEDKEIVCKKCQRNVDVKDIIT